MINDLLFYYREESVIENNKKNDTLNIYGESDRKG